MSGAAPGKTWMVEVTHFWGWSHWEVSLPTSQVPGPGWPEGSIGTVSQALTHARSMQLRVSPAQQLLWGLCSGGEHLESKLSNRAPRSCMSLTISPWKSHNITSSVICRSKQSQSCPSSKGEACQRTWGHLLRPAHYTHSTFFVLFAKPHCNSGPIYLFSFPQMAMSSCSASIIFNLKKFF